MHARYASAFGVAKGRQHRCRAGTHTRLRLPPAWTGDNAIPEPALKDLTVISVAASRHSAIVSGEGVVWTMGHNDSRCGVGGGGAAWMVEGVVYTSPN